MKIATNPGQRVDCGRFRDSRPLRVDRVETGPDSAVVLAEPSYARPQDPAAIRTAADRLRALVEKRGV
jgi:hypothetical protein